jgi:hypothetical protein
MIKLTFYTALYEWAISETCEKVVKALSCAFYIYTLCNICVQCCRINCSCKPISPAPGYHNLHFIETLRYSLFLSLVFSRRGIHAYREKRRL